MLEISWTYYDFKHVGHISWPDTRTTISKLTDMIPWDIAAFRLDDLIHMVCGVRHRVGAHVCTVKYLIYGAPNPKLIWFSPRLAVVYAQSSEASCWVVNGYVVGAAPTGDAPTTSEWSISNKFIASYGASYIKGLTVHHFVLSLFATHLLKIIMHCFRVM